MSVASDIREIAERLDKINNPDQQEIKEGFSGIDHWQSSDGAADFAFDMDREVSRLLAKEAKDQANEYNTPGVWNIYALYKDGAFAWFEANDPDGEVMKMLKQIIPHGQKWEEEFRANSGR